MLSNALITSCGLLISGKLKEVLQQHKLPAKHQFYDAFIYHKEVKLSYYWLHMICDLTNFVDYKKSTFFVYQNYAINAGNIAIHSKEDLFVKRENIKKNNPDKVVTIWASKIAIDRAAIADLDLFRISSFNSDYFISKELKLALNNHNIKGYQLKETNNLLLLL